MAQSNSPGRSPATWVAVTVLLLIAIAATLVVPIYARSSPMLGDFPFFYWYQLILLPVIAILCWICYLLLRSRPTPGSSTASTGGTPE